MNTTQWQQLMGVLAVLVTALNAWLIYRGSDRASKRTAEVQGQTNATSGFQLLTQEQRAELVDLRTRVRESETSARKAREAAEKAEEIAENCQERENLLILAYVALWEWADKGCPHPSPPPPRLPIESWQ